jgi:hypothetical protein
MVGIGNHEFDNRQSTFQVPSASIVIMTPLSYSSAPLRSPHGVTTATTRMVSVALHTHTVSICQTGAAYNVACVVRLALMFTIYSTASASGEWYSFDYGPMHIVFMSTEHNFTTDSSQYVELIDGPIIFSQL